MERNFSIPLNGTEEMLHESAGHAVLRILPLVVLSVTFVLGVLGNELVIWVAGFQMAHTVTTICYLNLALADFSFTATLPFLIVSMAMGEKWPFGWFLCKFINIMMSINLHGSVFLIAVIALDRCICVLYPVWVQNHRSVSLAKKVNIEPWILAAVFTLPTFIFSNTINDPQGNVYSLYTFESLGSTEEEQIKVLFAILPPIGIAQFIIGFCTPMSTIFVCYGLITAKIHGIGMMKSSRPFRVLIAVVASFFICWFPFQLIMLVAKVWVKEIETYKDKINVLLTLPLTMSLACFNTCLNPILYVFVGQDFRERLIHFLPIRLERALSEDFVQITDTVASSGACPAEGELTAMGKEAQACLSPYPNPTSRFISS